MEGQTIGTLIPITTVVRPGTVVIVQPDPPDDQTNVVAILAGTLGCRSSKPFRPLASI